MTFTEIFWEMYKRLEEANKRVSELEVENELLKIENENLYKQLDRTVKERKKKRS